MRIGIDARCLEWERGGVARILMNLLIYWPKLTNRHRYTLFWENRVPEDDFLTHPSFEHVIIKGPNFLRKRRVLTEQLLLPKIIGQSNLDLFFSPWYTAPMYCPCPKMVVGVWDISYTTHPDHFRFRERLRLSFLSRYASKRASGIFTCSPYDARQIEKFYKVPAERICTLQLAPEAKFKPVDDPKRIETLRRKYNLPERYILSMGMIFNRRNVDVIIDAFKEIYHEYPDVGLLVVGRNETQPFLNIEERLKPLIQERRAWYLLRAPEDELVDFYNGAWYYVCTSTVDGETIMLKEAMKCGIPVITSPLIEESLDGNAVIIQDPTSKDETAQVFRRILSSVELRERNAREGLEWVQKLSWSKTAEDGLKFLESR